MKQEIKVFDTTKNFAIDGKVGNIIFNKINDSLHHFDEVILDFENVDIVLSVFLNAAISGFYTNNQSNIFENKVKVVNLSDSAKILWDRVVQSAKRKAENN